MASNDYQFVTHWRVRSTPEEVSEILRDASDLARWWPSVYLDVSELVPGDERGIGKVVDLHTRGWLPYTLRWQFRVVESKHPYGFVLEASGDFVGRGEWTFEQDGKWTSITYDWRIRADKPLLRYLSPVMKPVFAANHLWAMRRGEESLKLELQRRHAASHDERALVPAPPGPSATSLGVMLVGAAGLAGLLLLTARAQRPLGRGRVRRLHRGHGFRLQRA